MGKNFEKWNKFFMAFGSVCNMLQGKVDLNHIDEVFDEVRKNVDKLYESYLIVPQGRLDIKEKKAEAIEEFEIEEFGG